MARPRKKYSFLTRLKFLFAGEIQVIEPRPSRAKKAKLIAGYKKLAEAEERYDILEPIK